jgi:drug/metabolite transporter (DMT)-like permease
LVIADKRGSWMRSISGTAGMVAIFYVLSSQALPLADTTSLIYLSPVFLAVLAPMFLRERTGARVAVPLAVALVGAVLILRPAVIFGGGALHHGPPAHGPSGTVTASVAILSALLSAIAMMMLRRVGQRESPEAVALHFSLVAAATFIVLSLFEFRPPRAIDLVLMLAAGVSGGLGQLALTRAYALDKAARVGGMQYLSVVTSSLLGAAVLHEAPRPSAVVGMALIIAGGVAASLLSRMDLRRRKRMSEDSR